MDRRIAGFHQDEENFWVAEWNADTISMSSIVRRWLSALGES
jgi:hypothetical protein